jgi:hypothetical protein
MREIQPRKGSADQRPSGKCGPNRFEKGRMPELKAFQRAGHNEHPNRNPESGSSAKPESKQEAPENFIKNPAEIKLNPYPTRTGVEFCRNPGRDKNEHRNQKSQDYRSVQFEYAPFEKWIIHLCSFIFLLIFNPAMNTKMKGPLKMQDFLNMCNRYIWKEPVFQRIRVQSK